MQVSLLQDLLCPNEISLFLPDKFWLCIDANAVEG